jgi:hypothetical protein
MTTVLAAAAAGSSAAGAAGAAGATAVHPAKMLNKAKNDMMRIAFFMDQFLLESLFSNDLANINRAWTGNRRIVRRCNRRPPLACLSSGLKSSFQRKLYPKLCYPSR